MMACTSPAFSDERQALQHFLAADGGVEILDLEQGAGHARSLTDRAFQADGQQVLRFHGELHRQLFEHGSCRSR